MNISNINKNKMLSIRQVYDLIPIESENKSDKYRRLRKFLNKKGQEKGINVFTKSGHMCYTTLHILEKLLPDVLSETIDDYKEQIETLKAENKALKDKLTDGNRRKASQ